MNSASQLTFDLTEQGFVPDLVIRRGIRYLVKKRLREIEAPLRSELFFRSSRPLASSLT